MDRLVHRVASVMSTGMAATILGSDRVRTWDLSFWYRVSRSKCRDSMAKQKGQVVRQQPAPDLRRAKLCLQVVRLLPKKLHAPERADGSMPPRDQR
jgi:hypothetical protein